MSYAEAIRDAMAIALERDRRVILMGEDIGVYGGAFQVTGDLIDRFGPDRVMDTPISELGGAGVAVGAALTGLRPIFEFQFSDFATLAMEQIVNQAAKLRYMLGGEASVPAGHAHAVGIRHRRRRPAQPEPRGVVRPRSGAEGGAARDARPTPRACCSPRSRTPIR